MDVDVPGYMERVLSSASALAMACAQSGRASPVVCVWMATLSRKQLRDGADGRHTRTVTWR